MRTLILFLILAFAAGFFGAQFTPGDWYAALAKPDWNPPSWLFGPVWTLLYIAMAVAAWLVWRDHRDVRVPLAFWGGQLVLNALWSWIFFGLHEIGWALIEISILLTVLVVTCALFWRVRRAAGVLLLPYIAWVSFATLLTATIWRLNG